MMCSFPVFFVVNPYRIVVAGTDEGSEGNWRFTFTDEQPFITDNVGIDPVRNCLQISLTGDIVGNTDCDYETDRTTFCESEGNCI